MAVKLTKRSVDEALPRPTRYAIYDSVVPGFGLRVFPSGQKSWVFDYRPGEGGRATSMKRVTIGLAASADGKKDPDYTPDGARKEAEKLRAIVLTGGDPQGAKKEKRDALKVAEIAAAFLADHVELKRKASTKAYYEDILNRMVLPALGNTKAVDVRTADLSRLHRKWKATPFLANRMLAITAAMYSYAAGSAGLVPRGTNPALGIEKYQEPKRERLLSGDELERLGAAMRLAETDGIPITIDPSKRVKHVLVGRKTVIGKPAVAAIRLLILTGARLREILHLKWSDVDFERGLLVLADHKTSRRLGAKIIVLNAPAIEVLSTIERIGVYVIAGDTAGLKDEKPRSDLKRPWALITKQAGLEGLRLHDLRHNFASFGVGGGMGLPVIGKLLGHAQPSTTARYAHFDNDPVRKASNTIGAAITAAMGPAALPANVVPIRKGSSAQ